MKIIDKNVSTYETLQKGFNLRWPPNVEQGAETIYICTTPDEVFAAANTALAAGNRITVRSGGTAMKVLFPTSYLQKDCRSLI